MYYIQDLIKHISGENLALLVALCVACSCISVAIAITSAIIGCILRIKTRIAKRREERRMVERKLKLTLPERENTFIQARVNTALNAETQNLISQPAQPISLSHALALLASLREKELSTADGLTCAELFAFLSLYKEKSLWTSKESQDINVALAGILKLSAKYSA